MNAHDLSGRWGGYLTPLKGQPVHVIVALQMSGTVLTGEYFAYSGEEEFHGAFGGSMDGRNMQLADVRVNDIDFDARLHTRGETQVITGLATFGRSSGPLYLVPLRPADRSAWDE